MLASFGIGFGTTVAIIDSGVSVTSAARRRVDEVCDFTVRDGDANDNTTTLHGTTVAELVLRYAPGVRLVAAKIGNELDRVNSLAVAKALTWAVDRGAQVINISLAFMLQGCLVGTCPICAMIEDLAARGIVVVVAGGNRQPDFDSEKVRCPAVSRFALTVGALDERGDVADYSVFGRQGVVKPDILAPGSVVFKNGRPPNQGTSFAAPVVTAAVAILGQKIGYSRAANLLKETAVPMQHSIYPTGKGRLDLLRALEAARHEGLVGSTEGQG